MNADLPAKTEPKVTDQHHGGGGCCGHSKVHTAHSSAGSARGTGSSAETLSSAHEAIDPVCGMRVDQHTAKHRHQYEGRTYYFCSAGCRSKFAADPEAYLKDDG